MKQEVFPLSIKHQIVVQEVGDELFIYELKTNKILCLNQTSSIIWKLCDGTKSISEISKAIAEELKVKSDESIVWLTLDCLYKANLLENGEEILRSAGKIFSRREAAKRAGLITILALPIISTVIAPTAVQAQSGCIQFLDECIFDNFTQSNCCDPNARCRRFINFALSCVHCNSGDQVKLCLNSGCCTGIPEINRCCNGFTEVEVSDSPGQYWCVCD